LQTALSQPALVTPGSTIWLRGGRYTGGTERGGFLSKLTGTHDAPIAVRQFPGERATVTNSLDVTGAYTWFWGFDITSGRQAATVTVSDNIVFNNEAFGLHIYSKPADGRLSGFDIEGNVLFGNGSISAPVNRNNEILIGGTPPANDVVVRNNFTYREAASGF